ncbi:hypothetical protein KC343_g10381 [Hortaea werneckii]|uniref:DUF336-domain-containing protein n=1 Tax=Hortaea werneckii TaxID=91943 RepID=A0A3M7CBQ2_HORWE|nr:hypothetical protein KC323_g8290 [Hortaea werneckii]KAI6859294.1 hypothetical protein KC338_g7373 [Hortaea werneckii]KAI7206044.1 hypothetical protein KC352_g18204 [Hortaea werneckii]KAI7356308.1 hypothetical protein KC320_g2261 [Hortaea werneckii]KAI7560128.1 hypothetical protein KC317_g9922 [Hortaea werneckii]
MANSNSQAVQAIPHLTLYAAQIASAAAIGKAQQIQVPENIAIVDTSARLLHFQRMPGAKYASIDIAVNKAFTAAAFGLPTHSYGQQVSNGGPLFGINNSNGGKFMTIGGGLPIEIDGQLVGAIGCSTGTPEEDRQVAQAGVDAILKHLEKQNGQ